MRTLREIARLAEAGRLAVSGGIAAPTKRIILPGESSLEASGLFSISRSQLLQYYLGRLPESWAIIQWPLPPTSVQSVLLEDAVARDIAALLSFVFQRRITLVDEVRTSMQGTTSTTFIPTAHKVDSRLYAPITGSPDAVWTALRALLSIANDKQFQAIANAITLYHAATSVAEIDYSAGYLLLVSAMESLAAEFIQSTVTFDQWSEGPRWNKWIRSQSLDENAANSLRDELLNSRAVRLRQRFIGLGLKAATDEFLNLPWETCFPRVEMSAAGPSRLTGLETQTDSKRTPADIRPARLRSLLSKVYDHRSSFVHAGSSFPAAASLDLPTEVEFETQWPSGKRKKVSLPSFSWFERLTWFAIRHCLDTAEKDAQYKLPDVTMTPPTF